jgi:ABC-type polysaccharide/polyol phosphate export permease
MTAPVLRRATPPPVLAECWRLRELARRLVMRNLAVRFQRSLLGVGWAFITPLATIAALSFVFSRVVPIGIPNYWAFLFSGFFVWNFATQALYASSSVIAEHAHMVRSVSFPPELLVVSSTVSRMVEFLFDLMLVVVVLAIFHLRALPSALLLLPLLLAVQFLIVLGLAFPVAAMSIFFHDVQHALPVLLTILIYLSPVFYPITLVPESARWIYELNPVAQLLGAYHAVLYEGVAPDAFAIMRLTVVAIAVFLAGYGLFRFRRAYFAEIV